MFEDKNESRAIRWAHISAIFPIWGLLVSLVCYRFISAKAPERKSSVVESFFWQLGLNSFHFGCALAVILSYAFTRSSNLFFIPAAAVFIVWITGFVFAILTSFTAARQELSGNSFRYPIFSSYIRRKKKKTFSVKGSIYYPFEDQVRWK